MQPEHPFPGMPLPLTSKVSKPTTPTPSKPFNPNAIGQGTPSLPTHPPSSDSRTALVGSPYSDPQKKWIVVDADGSETWFSGHDGAWGWFMASSLATRLYLLCEGKRSLIGGLPINGRGWHPQLSHISFEHKFGAKVACYTYNGECLGACNFEHGNTPQDKLYFALCGLYENGGWRFYPNVKGHRPGVKFHLSYKECIPAWATPLIVKWVLCE
jgi:hypothetical protein